MYAPSKLLEQIKRQVMDEFKEIITSFQWVHEEEYTGIYIEIEQMTWNQCVDDYTHQLIDSILGDQYMVSVLVRPIESVGVTDGLFNLTYYGASHIFFVDYYAPERARSNPFKTSIYYTKMIKAMRRIYLDSPREFWAQLFRPIKETLATSQGVHSFSKELAPDLRDFFLEHLDFIQRMVQASGEQLEILLPPPQSIPLQQPSNGTEPKRMPRQKHVRRLEHGLAEKEQALLQPALAA